MLAVFRTHTLPADLYQKGLKVLGVGTFSRHMFQGT